MKIKDGDLNKEVYVQGFESLYTALNAEVQPGEWVRWELPLFPNVTGSKNLRYRLN